MNRRGVGDWLGAMPTTWSTTPLKHTVRFTNGFGFTPDEWSDTGIPIIRIENLNGSPNFNRTHRIVDPRYAVRRGDLLFGWSGNRGTSFGPYVWGEGLDLPSEDDQWLLNQHIFLISDYAVEKRWLYWALKAATRYIEQQTDGIIGMVHVTREELGAVHVPDIPLAQQRSIADYLDAETSRIDALTRRREHTIQLLHERWKAERDDLLYAMDAASAPLRRFVKSITQGVSPVGEDRRAEGDEWAVLKLSAVKDGEFRHAEHKVIPPEVVPVRPPTPEIGDVLITRANTPALVGDVCVVREHVPRRLLSDLIYKVVLDQRRMIPEYVGHVLLSGPVKGQLTASARGTSQSMVKLRGEDILDLSIPVPSKERQEEIAQRLESSRRELDAGLRAFRRQIALLIEHRQALITEAVTGELPIPGVAA